MSGPNCCCVVLEHRRAPKCSTHFAGPLPLPFPLLQLCKENRFTAPTTTITSVGSHIKARTSAILGTLQMYDIGIAVCIVCNCNDFDWRPSEDEADTPECKCTKCIDQRHLMRRLSSFATLHRQLFDELPPLFSNDLFTYGYRANCKQWKTFNRRNREQRLQTLRLFPCGAPWSSKYIYDLHQQLEMQANR